MSGAATEVAFLTRALKMPRAREVAASLADQARDQGWDYQEFLAKVLAEEHASRELHGGENRIRARYRRQGPAGFRICRHLRYRRSDIERWINHQVEDSRHDPGAKPTFRRERDQPSAALDR